MTPELERIEIPGAADAADRARKVVLAAFSERPPLPARRRAARPLVAVAVAAVIVAAIASPPGRAVIDHVRRAVGIDRAEPALFSLPAPGGLLLSSDSGVWVARDDGARRLLGHYAEASWSPFGRYIVATRGNELAALDTDGNVRWSIARPLVRSARWSGRETDTRIAYLSGSSLHVIAGDGKNDADIAGSPPANVAPAWSTQPGFVLAYADVRGHVEAVLTAKGGPLWSVPVTGSPSSLEWSSDGRQLLVVTPRRISVLDGASGRELVGEPAGDIVAAAYRPDGRAYAELHRSAGSSWITLGGRTVFSLGGELEGLTWSPNGRWLLTAAPASDQFVFVRADGKRLTAVSNVSEQFRSRAFPRVEGWCCSP